MRLSKQAVSIFLAGILLLTWGAGAVWAEGDLDSEALFMVGEASYFKGEAVYSMDVAPYLKDGRVFMPTRYIANALNINDAQIGWDETSKTVIINNYPLVLNITLGDPLIWLGLMEENAVEINLADETGLVMDTVPEIQNGRVMLPLRFIAEALGAEVSWDSATQTVALIPSLDEPSSTFYRVQERGDLYEAQPTSEAPGESVASPSNDLAASLGDQVIALVNEERNKAGLPTLAKGGVALGEACQVRAEELVQLFSHTRPDGSSCFTVLDEFDLNYQTCGENIAWGQATAEEVMEDWMNSPGHRENILNPDFTQIGVGVYPAEHGYNWVQLFMTPF